MARSDPFNGLSEFLAIARCGSFRAAAAELGVTPGAVSQALQALERRLGLPLFHRTTRTIALTEAGERLLARAGPAAATITGTLDELNRLRAAPAGMLRLLVHRLALPHVIVPVLPDFGRAYPGIEVEIVVDDTHAEIVGGRFDAGIRLGEFIDRDMIARRVSPVFDWMVLGSPDYFARHGRPLEPEALAGHACLRFRRSSSNVIYRWEFERDGQALTIEPPGAVTVNEHATMRALAVAGMGLIYAPGLQARADIEAGLLEPVLESFMPARDSFFICFPRASRNQPKLRVFVEACARLASRPGDDGRASADA